MTTKYIRSFLEIGLHDVGLVGGKTASLGELYSVLSSQGVAVPNGFAITADAYRDALSQGDVADVAFDFDERDPGMLEMFRQAVTGAKRNGRHVGICGEAPANYPEIARYLTQLGIDSISVNPSSVFRTMAAVVEAESRLTKTKT